MKHFYFCFTLIMIEATHQPVYSRSVSQIDKSFPTVKVVDNKTRSDPKPLPLKAKTKTSQIRVHNGITEQMITYNKHYSGSYKPDSFLTTVNGISVGLGDNIDIPINSDRTITVVCEFAFNKVWVKRKKEKTITLDPNESKAIITFSWDHDDRIVIEKK
jgi:hypothetical protein